MAQPASQKQITVGDIRITYLPDRHGRIDKFAMFPGTTPEGWRLHPEWLDESGRVVASIGGFLIQTGGRNVLVDVDQGLARRTRDRVMRELEDPSTVSADGHFADAVFGRVMPAQGKRQWRGIP